MERQVSRLVFHSPLNPLGLSRVRRCNQGEGEALGLLCFRNAKLFLFMLAAVSQSREVVCCNRAPGELPPASPPPPRRLSCPHRVLRETTAAWFPGLGEGGGSSLLVTWRLCLHPQPLRGTRGACEIPRCRGSVGAGLRQSGGASPDGESGAWERVYWS